PLAEDPLPLPCGRYRLPPFADTALAGFYTFELVLDRESGKEAVTLPFAVNVLPDEGELRFAAHEQVKQALAIPRVLDGLPDVAGPTEDPDRSELGPTFLLLLLAFVLAETALARQVSVRRN
ncbi:MAG: hypothetical protein WAT39_13090, partial [Planctomycetota bacterium]